MAMTIMNNSGAMMALGQAKKNDTSLGKQLKKVSSGMKINGAGDDAAGYSISERMRVRIRGLYQCDDNTKTGFNMLNLASQAINEQVQVMQKLKENALKASDDTYSQVDRDILQSESDHLMDELDAIAYGTNYNGIPLLDGKERGKESYKFDSSGPPKDNAFPLVAGTNMVPTMSVPPVQAHDLETYTVVTPTTRLYDPNNNGAQFTSTPPVGTQVWLSPPTTNAQGQTVNPSYTATLGTEPGTGNLAAYGTPSGKNAFPLDYSTFTGAIPTDLNQEGFALCCTACNQFINVIFDATAPAGNLDRQNDKGNIALLVGIGGTSTTADVNQAMWTALSSHYPTSGNTIKIRDGHDIDFMRFPNGSGGFDYVMFRPSSTDPRNSGYPSLGSHLAVYDGVKGSLQDTSLMKPEKKMVVQGDTKGSLDTRFMLPNTTVSVLFPSDESRWQLDPEEEDYPKDDEWSSDYSNLPMEEKRLKWRNEVWPYTKKGAGRDGSNLRTRQRAEKFLDDIDQAMKYLLASNTTVGAQLQRLEAMNSNLVTNHENTQAAESTIRDANMAKEMTGYTKANILTQSAQAMLAQANQNSSNVLSLLQ